MTLTTDKASHTTFILTRFKTGYSTQEVDAFMQEFIAALRSWETGTPYGVLTSRDVTSRTFTPTRFRHGYEQGGVDAFMQEAAATLQAWETGTITGPPDDDRRPSGYGSQPVGAPQPVGIAQQASTPAGVLTSQEVMNAKFSATRFSEGYEQDAVDAFLDRVITTLQAWETGTATSTAGAAATPAELLTFYDVMDAKFLGTKFEGYEQSEVDAFLDRVITTLQAWETDSVPSASDPQTALTSQDVLNKKFSATRFSEGYEQDEIDEFLDEITETLRAWEKRTAAGASQSADAPSGMLTSQDVLNKKFSVGKFFEGYEQSEVDAFLDEIMRALRNYEARAGR